LNFGTLAGLWPWAIGPNLKIEILGVFHRQHEIFDPKSIVMPYFENFELWPDCEQAQMTMGPKQKTFLVLRPFEGALT
jgi:hypothetical protein